MDETEKKLKAELDNMQLQASVDANQSWRSDGWKEGSEMNSKAEDADASKSAIQDKLENKKKELVHCIFNHRILLIFFTITLLFIELLLSN